MTRTDSGVAHRWTPAEVRALGTVTTIETAAEILGVSRSAAYGAARRGTFPVPVLKITVQRWRVPVGALLRVLGFAECGDNDPLSSSDGGSDEEVTA